MENPLWGVLSAQVRDRIDELLLKGHRIQAVKVIRDAAPEPLPGLPECLDLLGERYAALGKPVHRAPTAPLNVDTLAARVEAMPSRPAAIEALWDGDTEGWCVHLVAVTTAPNTEHSLALIRFGGDLRLFNGAVPPWPEAVAASTVGRALAERFAVPFHFASPEVPDDAAARWWDGR
jgi:hypothetical protein